MQTVWDQTRTWVESSDSGGETDGEEEEEEEDAAMDFSDVGSDNGEEEEEDKDPMARHEENLEALKKTLAEAERLGRSKKMCRR